MVRNEGNRGNNRKEMIEAADVSYEDNVDWKTFPYMKGVQGSWLG